MATVQVVIDEPLLREADRAARALKLNRSEFVRAALREHLRRSRAHERERLDREGYRRVPEQSREAALWDRVAAWPEGHTPSCSSRDRSIARARFPDLPQAAPQPRATLSWARKS